MKSFSYFLTMLVIRMTGIKNVFSRDPIDFKKLRKDDIHVPKIPNATQFMVEDTLVTEISNSSTSIDLILYVHGGAFVYGPAKHHWAAVKNLQAGTNNIVWMIDYPKAPEHNISQISKNIDLVYQAALQRTITGKISLIGDSVGATLITALTQRLIKDKTPLPSLLVLISPVMDASLKNEAIPSKEKGDPMLSRIGVLSAKKMCAENGNLEDPSISPLIGDFKGFPYTVLYIAEHDITSPDQELFVQKMEKMGLHHKIFRGKSMPHIWPILPVMRESKIAFKSIIAEYKRS